MNSRELSHLAAVFAVALVLRAILFNYVGIWGDLGFYVYDSRLILAGQAPFVDFLGRSPLFNYLFAWTRGVFGHPIRLVRVFIIFWWFATAIPVYFIARELRGHRVGVAALVVFLWSPFQLVYGMWANTQAVAAFFAALAVLTLIRSERHRWIAVAGGLMGLAYLSRRSIIVVLGAAGLWMLWDQGRQHNAREVVTRGATITTAFVATLIVGYAAVVGWDPAATAELFRIHTLNLFFTYGRGGFPLLWTEAELVTNRITHGRIPIFNDVCQMCGSWTARTFAKTIVVTTSIVGICWFYFRDITDQYFDEATFQYSFGIFGALGLYASVLTLRAGYFVRLGVIIALALFAIVAYRSDRISREELYGRRMNLILFVLAGLTIGYLYRNRVLHTYYFMDFWPYLAVVAGFLYTKAWENLDTILRVLLVIAVILGAITSLHGAYPLATIVLEDNADNWFTMGNIDDVHADINQRTEPGEVVFSASPTFIGGTHARMPNDNPRLHMVAVRYKDSGPAVQLYRTLIDGMRSGDIRLVIVTRTTAQMLRWNATADQVFRDNYCEVPITDDPYAEVGATLYKRQSDCPPARRPAANEVLG